MWICTFKCIQVWNCILDRLRVLCDAFHGRSLYYDSDACALINLRSFRFSTLVYPDIFQGQASTLQNVPDHLCSKTSLPSSLSTALRQPQIKTAILSAHKKNFRDRVSTVWRTFDRQITRGAAYLRLISRDVWCLSLIFTLQKVPRSADQQLTCCRRRCLYTSTSPLQSR